MTVVTGQDMTYAGRSRRLYGPMAGAPLKLMDACDRPREKLLSKGQNHLTSRELLQVIVGSGIKGNDVGRIADDLLVVMEDSLARPTVDRLTKVRGVSHATAARLVAGLELADRLSAVGMKITDEDDVLGLLAGIRHKKQEHFVAITVDGAQRLIARRTITVGTLNASLVHPREVFAAAITDRAAGIVVAHNHPGGSLEPSGADIVVTKRLRAAGELLGIRLLDHIIVTAGAHRAIEQSE